MEKSTLSVAIFPIHPNLNSLPTNIALDLGIFGIQKQIKARIRSNYDVDPQTDDIRKIVNSYIKATTPDNVTSSFYQAGIGFDTNDKGFFTIINIEHARAVRNMEHTSYEIPANMRTSI